MTKTPYFRRRAARSVGKILTHFQTQPTREFVRDVGQLNSHLTRWHTLADIGQVLDKARPKLANWPLYAQGLGLRLEDKTLTLMVVHRLQEARLSQTLPTLKAALVQAGFDIDELVVHRLTGPALARLDEVPEASTPALVLPAHTKPGPTLTGAAHVWAASQRVHDHQTQQTLLTLCQSLTPAGVTPNQLVSHYLECQMQALLRLLDATKAKKEALINRLTLYPEIDYTVLPANHPALANRQANLQARRQVSLDIEACDDTLEALIAAITFCQAWQAKPAAQKQALPMDELAVYLSVLEPEAHQPTPAPFEAAVITHQASRAVHDAAQHVSSLRLRQTLAQLSQALDEHASHQKTTSLEAFYAWLMTQSLNQSLPEHLRHICHELLHTPLTPDSLSQTLSWLAQFDELQPLP